MILMAVNRIKDKHGRYTDEERSRHRFDYLYDYERGGFSKSGRAGFKRALLTELQRLKNEEGINTPKAGIFIHGYNTDYKESIGELLNLEKNFRDILNYPAVIAGFSWPSSGHKAYYLSDREEARDSVGAFTRFLLDINNFMIENEQDCFSTTYCIAHSMGNYLLRKGMEYLSDYLGTPAGRMLFAETVMIAPDLASADIEFDGKGRYIADFSRRVHVYYSKHDRALKASSIKRFGGSRLGRHGADDYENLPENVVLVNAKKYASRKGCQEIEDLYDKEVSVHSSYKYHPRILQDIISVISSIDRGLIEGRKPAGSSDRIDVYLNNHFKLV